MTQEFDKLLSRFLGRNITIQIVTRCGDDYDDDDDNDDDDDDDDDNYYNDKESVNVFFICPQVFTGY